MPGSRKQPRSKPKSVQSLAPARSLASREAALLAREESLRAREETAAQGWRDLDVAMVDLREANENLVLANLRSLTLAQELSQAFEKVTSASQAKDDFFALLSHELRTPLTSITGWADLLGRDPDPPTIAEAARSIASSAALQCKLVDDLLDVSRIMTGKFAIDPEEIDLVTVVDAAVSAMRPAAGSKGISLRANEQEPILIMGDAAKLGQAVGNLLSNALKFTPTGGLIEIDVMLESPFGVVSVCDTGEGIPFRFLPDVFDRHAQAASRRFGGLGLGLAIVKHIVELHGGSVKAASAGEGKGATFTVRIPTIR